jgi:hypothetical protein
MKPTCPKCKASLWIETVRYGDDCYAGCGCGYRVYGHHRVMSLLATLRVGQDTEPEKKVGGIR